MAILWGEPVASEVQLMTADALAGDKRFESGFELIEGRLVKTAPAGFTHGQIIENFSFAIQSFIRPRKLGVVVAAETGFLVSPPDQPDTVLAPDVAFVRAENVPPPDAPDRGKYVRLIPDLVVEVASPNQYKPEMASKAQYWLEVGVRLVWVAWPESQMVDIWRSGQGKLTLRRHESLEGYDVLAGFTHPIGQLF